MVDMRTWNRRIVSELISLYQSHPCLWKVKSEEYKNKILKETAYDELIGFCKRKGFDEANRDFVVKKIQSLRSSFRKELKKVTDSQRSGSVYKSSLWYFDILLFTKDQELHSSNSMCNIEDVEPEDEDLSNDDDTNGLHEEEEQNKSDDATIESDAAPHMQRNKRKYVQINRREVTADTVRADAEKLSEYDIAGLNVTRKLAKMNYLQSIYAESLINNVLTKGLLNKLNEDTDLCQNDCNRRSYSRTCENQTPNTSVYQFASVPSTQMYQEDENQDMKPIIP